MAPLSPEIENYYRLGLESVRLTSAVGELECQRTQQILSRWLPPPPAVIFDVGGAAGVYAFPLAEQGYVVHLVDPMDLHLEQARSRQASSGNRLASIRQGDARSLEAPDQAADAVLLLGPLYHLTEPAARLAALREARRVLKPGSLLFAAAISRFASLMSGVSEGFFADPAFREIIAADLRSGQHRNPSAKPQHFTTAYFHHPAELAAELCEAGFEPPRILAVEGPVWTAAHFSAAWADPAQREELLSLLAQVEEEPSMLGASAHLLAIARRPSLGENDRHQRSPRL